MPMKLEHGNRAMVLGGGIVGVCCAYALARRGFDVSIIEKDTPGRAASFGNSGSIGLGSVPPLGMPGILRDVPKMLIDSGHPLVIRWRSLHKTLPWLLKFRNALAPARVEAIAAARAHLLSHAGAAYDSLLNEIGHSELIYGRGLIATYETQAAFERARAGIELRRRHGITCTEMTGAALRELEPALSGRVVAGYHYPAVRTVIDPYSVTTAVLDAFRALGGHVLRETVLDFERGLMGVARVITDVASHDSDLVVLATGAWTRELAAKLGDRIQVTPERGYHIMIDTPPDSPTIPIMAGDRNVTITSMTGGLRMTTMAEFTTADAPPDHDRALRLFQAAAGVIRGLEVKVASRWMGSRPSTPDSLPVIGRSPNAANVIYASGHGHLGLTFGAVTASIVAQLARDETPNLDISAFRPDRAFDGSHLPPR
jgi:D-amino-acid dehydrogenase